MQIINIDKNNISQEHICCAIGNDKNNRKKAEIKKNWMKQRFADGLIFKRLDDRGKIFIEYMPVEKAWKPIIGTNFMLINCLWVSGKFKGKGIATKLLNTCIDDVKKQQMDGIIVISSTKIKPFLTDKKFYLHNNFEIIDTAFPYFELLALKFNKNAKNPKFNQNAKKGICDNKIGLTYIFSNQCPFVEEFSNNIKKIAIDNNIPFTAKKLTSFQDAKKHGSCFGTLGLYYNGKFLTHEIMSDKKIKNLLINCGNK